MSRDYHNICSKINQSNDDLYRKDIVLKEIAQVKKDIDKLSSKLDKIYTMIVNLINGGEY